MSYPPIDKDGNIVGYGPPRLDIPIDVITARFEKLKNACHKKKVNSLHYEYYNHFNDVLPESHASKISGSLSVQHKTTIMQCLLFSDEARTRQLSDPEFARLTTWAGHAVNLARCIATSLRMTLSDKIMIVSKIAREGKHSYTAEQQLSELRHIAAALDEKDWKPLTTLSELSTPFLKKKIKKFPCLNPPNGKQQEFLAEVENEMICMLRLEGSGALSVEGSVGGIVKGLLCLTKLQSSIEGTLDAHGIDFWFIHVVQTSLCRNTSRFLVDNSLDFDAGVPIGQKSNRAAAIGQWSDLSIAAEIWGDIIRGTHNSVGQKVCCLVLKLIRVPLLKRYWNLRETRGASHLRRICATFDTDFPDRPLQKASDLQELYSVDRHGSSDAKTRSGTTSRHTKRSIAQPHALDLTRCLPEKLKDWCETIPTDGRRSGVGLALDGSTVCARIKQLRHVLYTELVQVELDLAIADQYRQLYVEQLDIFQERYTELRNDLHKKNEFAGNATVRLLRTPEEDEDGRPIDHRRINISISCFEMHASAENKEKYGTDENTLLPDHLVDSELVFCPSSSPRHVYRGSIPELFGRNGTTGTHSTPDDRGRFRDKQRVLLHALHNLEQTRKSAAVTSTGALCVPAVVAAAAQEPDMEAIWPILNASARIEVHHLECRKAVDYVIATETSMRMATRITQAWTSMVETTRTLQIHADNLPPVNNFKHYSFLFETLCFAAIASGGREAMMEIVKMPVDAEGVASFPQIVPPMNESTLALSGWANNNWPIFCAIAESAARFFDSKSETFLSNEGSVVEITTDGRFLVNEERMHNLRPALMEHMEGIKAVYGETCPTSLCDLCSLAAKSHISVGHVLSFWLSWNGSRVAKKVVLSNGKDSPPMLPVNSRMSSQEAKQSPKATALAVEEPSRAGESISPMLMGAQFAKYGKAQILEMIKMSTTLLRKAPIPAVQKKRKAEETLMVEMDEYELFGSE